MFYSADAEMRRYCTESEKHSAGHLKMMLCCDLLVVQEKHVHQTHIHTVAQQANHNIMHANNTVIESHWMANQLFIHSPMLKMMFFLNIDDSDQTFPRVFVLFLQCQCECK